jgi:nitrite reductase/ring-hydroxylating ferredoxin subunit
MAKHVVAKVSEIPLGGRLLVTVRGRSIGIFNVNGHFYALLNRCPHQGAELCRGSVLGRLDADAPGQLRWTDESYMLQCPWHGWEYDLETGQSYFNSAVRPYPVGVEQGQQVREEQESGQAADTSSGEQEASLATGLSAPMLKPGPFVAETFPVEVEQDYVVITLPGRAAARPARIAEVGPDAPLAGEGPDAPRTASAGESRA